MSSGRTPYLRASSHHRSISACSRVGLPVGQVVALRRVDGHVVQLPPVLLEADRGVLDRVVGHGLPAVLVEGTAPEDLVVLHEVVVGGRRVGEAVGERDPVDRGLRHATQVGGRLDPEDLEQGGQHVDGMDVLAAQGPGPVRAGRPVDDHRVGHAPFVHLALPAPERGVAGHGPAPRIVVVAERPADLVDPGHTLLDRARRHVPGPEVVDRPGGSALGARPVVGQHDQDGVVEVAGALEELDEATQLVVGVREEAGERLHVPGVQALLVGGEGVPGRYPVGPGGELAPVGEDPPLPLPFERGSTPLVPAGVEAAPVALDPRGRGLVGRVAGPGAEVEEERLVHVDRPQVPDPLDGVVHQVLGEVVALLGRGRRRHLVVVRHQGRHELVGLPLQEPVEALEAPAEGPAAARGGQVAVVLGGEVPLAQGEGGPAALLQHLRQEPVGPGNGGVVPGEAGGELSHPAHAVAVVVAAGQQAGPRRRAQGRGVEVGVLQSGLRQPVDDRGLEVRTEAAELGEADVVEHHQDDVRRAGSRSPRGRPPRRRPVEVVGDDPLELPRLHRTTGGVGSAARTGLGQASPRNLCQRRRSVPDDRVSTGPAGGPAVA